MGDRLDVCVGFSDCVPLCDGGGDDLGLDATVSPKIYQAMIFFKTHFGRCNCDSVVDNSGITIVMHISCRCRRRGDGIGTRMGRRRGSSRNTPSRIAYRSSHGGTNQQKARYDQLHDCSMKTETRKKRNKKFVKLMKKKRINERSTRRGHCLAVRNAKLVKIL